MKNVLTKYLVELENELQIVNERLESSGQKKALEKERAELEKKVQKLKSLIDKRNSTFVIKTKQGFLTSDGNFTNNVQFAYTFDEEEAISKAITIGGWLEGLPNSDFIK
jgi:predicted nuclease with TOPRIM domain